MTDVSAYLLGELDPEQTAAFERALAADAKLRDEVERLRPIVTRLERLPVDTWEGPEPPPLRLPGEAAGVRGDAPGRGRRLVLRPLAAAACAVVLLAAGAGLGFLLDREPSPSAQLALRPIGDLDPSASGKVSLVSDGVDVRVSGLKPTGGGQFYELWLLGADKRLVGLGSFRVDAQGKATLTLPLPVDPKQFTYFDLSLEPSDGDPGHSGVSVLRGPSAA
ncbi:anti-sigma factor domain-containing protein [Solirubrobacter soli]|uniref:anti-sigma factor domain-containing protein n=1 Tax=Solirubrobacter soli TaxID=363832 RepID=UPI0003F82CBC|nr:anti-sigma factor [Solirubrobacter soli]